jgi:predicted histone-like DNA-binding protein
MAIKIKLQKYKNNTKSSYGKWYAQTVPSGVMTTAKLAKVISENSSPTPGDVIGVLSNLAAEMRRALLDGKKVELDGIGTFHIVAKSEGVENPDDFNIGKHIKGYQVKFLPIGHRDPITWSVQREFTSKATAIRQPIYDLGNEEE